MGKFETRVGPLVRALVGVMRLLTFALPDIKDPFKPWKGLEQEGRAAAAFASGLVAGALLAGVLMALNGWLGDHPGELAAAMMSFGPLMVFVAIGAGSAIEVGLIGHYGDEDMREWRASLGAYLLIIGDALGDVLGALRFRPAVDLEIRCARGVRGRGWMGGHIGFRRLARPHVLEPMASRPAVAHSNTSR